jgi:hypothetical protein
MDRNSWGRRIAAVAVLALALFFAARTDVLVAAWDGLVELITIEGPPVPASLAVLSTHEVDELESLPPQTQAERLLERAINHYDGASSLIASRVDSWRQKIKMEGSLNGLFMTAMNSNDLRVRAAGIELYLAAYDCGKTEEDLDRIMGRCDRQAEGRPHYLWTVGLLGNRGVAPRRALDYLLSWSKDADEETRHWAIEGIAMLGTDDSIAPLLETFHDDPSPVVRERAACGLAQHGMLTQKQRLTAVPELVRFRDDPALDDKTRGWAVQALADITGERTGDGR